MDFFNPFISPYTNRAYSTKHGLRIQEDDGIYYFTLYDHSPDAVKAFENLYVELSGRDMDMDEFEVDDFDTKLIQYVDGNEPFLYSYKKGKPFERFWYGGVKTYRENDGSLMVKAFNPKGYLKPLIRLLGIPDRSIRTCYSSNTNEIVFQSFTHSIKDGFIDVGDCYRIKPNLRLWLMKVCDLDL